MRDQVAQHILEKTVELILKGESIPKLTVRQLASEAGVSLGAINYYFKTKDTLIKEATEMVLAEAVEREMIVLEDESLSPEMQLKHFVMGLTRVFYKYKEVAQIFLKSEFDHANLGSVTFIVPKLREIYGGRIKEEGLWIKAIQIVIPMQYVFIHQDKIQDKIGKPFQKQTLEDVEKVINQMMDNILYGASDEV